MESTVKIRNIVHVGSAGGGSTLLPMTDIPELESEALLMMVNCKSRMVFQALFEAVLVKHIVIGPAGSWARMGGIEFSPLSWGRSRSPSCIPCREWACTGFVGSGDI